MANSLNTEVSVNTQENTQRMGEELGRERDSPLLLDHHHMSSPDEFTPEIHDQDNRGEYRFQCPSAGLFQCSLTGLVFRMEGEGEVLYRTVPWDRSLLAQKGKRPAGPLFNIDCPQKSVSQLHLPHCEILSEGGCDFLSVAHVTDDIEFIPPLETTEKHIIINITGFSAYGEVKDDNAPITSINAHVLLFYLPQPVPRRKATLNVLLLPSNVVIREVKEKMEHLSDSKVIYIITPSECELIPQQHYSLSTDLVQTGLVIQPKIKRFVDNHSSENYVPAFQVLLQYDTMEVNLFLRKENPGSTSTVREDNVWENLVLLPATPPADDSAVTPPGGVTAASKLHEPAAPPMDISIHPPQQTSTLPPTSKKLVAASEREQKPAGAERTKVTSTSSGMLTRSGEKRRRLERQRKGPKSLDIRRSSMLEVLDLLLATLEELTEEQLETFQSHLTSSQLPGFPPIPESQLENVDRQDTVDQMVERYDHEGAVEITVEILGEMNLHDLAKKLQRDHRGKKRKRITPPTGDTAGTTKVHFLLLNTLKGLGRGDLKTFQWYLINGVEGFPSISTCQLEKATRPTTVDRMVQSYCDEGAVKITLEILRKMDQNKMADELEKKFTNNV